MLVAEYVVRQQEYQVGEQDGGADAQLHDHGRPASEMARSVLGAQQNRTGPFAAHRESLQQP